MSKRIVIPLATALLLSGCAAPVTVDQRGGAWGPQPLTPPAGLVSSRTDALIGASVDTRTRPRALVIEAVLIDPRDNIVDYFVARPAGSETVVMLPVSAVLRSRSGLYVEANDVDVSALPHVTLAQLEAAYAPQVAALPTPEPIPYVAPPSEPMHLVRRGNVVGYQVVDSYGQPLGLVDSVAAIPATGEVRYMIVSGPSLGPGNFIAIPVASGQTSGDRVIVTGTSASWAQTTRYRGDQVAQVFGP